MERLQKYIASCGITSRRKAEELILAGKVQVNRITVKELGVKINPMKDRLMARSLNQKRLFIISLISQRGLSPL